MIKDIILEFLMITLLLAIGIMAILAFDQLIYIAR